MHLVGHGNNGHALIGQTLHYIHNLTHQFRIKGRCGFIKKHYLGLHCQAPGDGNTLLLTTRKTRRKFIPFIRKTHPIKQLLGIGGRLFFGLTQYRQGSFDDISDGGHVGKQVKGLKAHPGLFADIQDLCCMIL